MKAESEKRFLGSSIDKKTLSVREVHRRRGQRLYSIKTDENDNSADSSIMNRSSHALSFYFGNFRKIKRKHIISITVMRYFYFLMSVITCVGPPSPPRRPFLYPSHGINARKIRSKKGKTSQVFPLRLDTSEFLSLPSLNPLVDCVLCAVVA